MNSDDESDKTEKRNLPSWISSTSRDVGNKSRGKEPGESNVGEETQLAKGHDRAHGILPSKGTSKGKRSASSSSETSSFSKILEGVVFVLSGFVNPERSTLRSQALEMGAEYQADWNSNCTLLVCAFRNTPKFRQVEADCGTIVSQEWISECYMQKKLVDIDSYLMHAGKPWRRGKISHEASHDSETPRTKKPHKQVINRSQSKSTAAVSTKDMQNGDPETSKGQFAPPTVKEWAFDDLDKTISWLNSQDEKPESSEIKNIAAEGILTCLQDAIDSLEQMQDIGQVTEQWRFVPRVVEELAKLEKDRSLSLPKKDLHKQAVICKEIYEAELKSLKDSEIKKRKPKESRKERGKEKDKDSSCNDAGYDSDETIEMSEEEIDTAYRNLVSVNSSVE